MILDIRRCHYLVKKMGIFNRCISGLMSNLIKKSWTVSSQYVWIVEFQTFLSLLNRFKVEMVHLCKILFTCMVGTVPILICSASFHFRKSFVFVCRKPTIIGFLDKKYWSKLFMTRKIKMKIQVFVNGKVDWITSTYTHNNPFTGLLEPPQNTVLTKSYLPVSRYVLLGA